MDFPGDTPNDQTGNGDTEAAVLGILPATNVTIRGPAILPVAGVDKVDVDGMSFAEGANGRASGRWVGIAPDGETLAAPKDGVAGSATAGGMRGHSPRQEPAWRPCARLQVLGFPACRPATAACGGALPGSAACQPAGRHRLRASSFLHRVFVEPVRRRSLACGAR